MPDLTPLYDLIPKLLAVFGLHLACLDAPFMQKALIALMLLAPMAAAMGVQVVNFRMAFFSDAISHSAFAGVAIGLLLSAALPLTLPEGSWLRQVCDPRWTMPLFGLLVGLGIMAMQRRSALSADTVIGVFFSAVVAFGLAVISHNRNVVRNVSMYLYGDILLIEDADIVILAALFVALMVFQAWGYNRLLYIGLNPVLAKAHRVRVAVYQYLFAALLSLVVILSVSTVGVLLVTAMLVVPAAAARNFARSAGSMFWLAIVVGLTSAVAGLLLSMPADTAPGATVIIVAFGWFLVSAVVALVRGESVR